MVLRFVVERSKSIKVLARFDKPRERIRREEWKLKNVEIVLYTLSALKTTLDDSRHKNENKWNKVKIPSAYNIWCKRKLMRGHYSRVVKPACGTPSAYVGTRSRYTHQLLAHHTWPNAQPRMYYMCAREISRFRKSSLIYAQMCWIIVNVHQRAIHSQL